MRLHPVPFPSPSAAWRRLLEEDPGVLDRLGGRGDDAEAASRLAASLTTPPAPAVGESLLRAAELDGADETSRANAAALARGEALAVLTGQQPGWVGGASLTILKALSAAWLARRLTRSLDRPVVPVFWVASDDHDLAEMAGVSLLDPAGEVRRVRAPVEGWRRPAHALVFGEEAAAWYDRFVELLPPGSVSERIARVGRPRAGERWPAPFRRLLHLATRGTGLVVFDPGLAQAATQSPLRDVAAAPGPHLHALRRGAEHLRALGLEAPLPSDVSSPVFLDDGTRRRRLAPLEQPPDDASLSPDAGLRAVLQSMLFPVLAVIGGPGELAYWMQLPELFVHHGVPFPLFAPRLGATFLDEPSSRARTALGWAPEELVGPTAPRAPEHPLEPHLQAALADAERAVERLAGRVAAEHPSLSRPADRLRTSCARAFERTMQQVRRRLEERAGVDRGGRERLLRWARPRGRPQERTLSGLSLLPLLGEDLYPRLLESLPERPLGVHLLVEETRPDARRSP